MSEESKAIRIFPTKEELASFISDGVLSAVSNLPLAATDIGTYLLTTGAAFSAARIGEWGKVVTSFIKSNKAKEESEAMIDYEKFFETLRFLAKEQPADNELLNALKNLHILSLSKDTKATESVEIYMILDTVKKLSGDEILTILAAYKIGKNQYLPDDLKKYTEGFDMKNAFNNSKAWAIIISRACGYSTTDYVIRQEKHLEDLHLLNTRLEHRPGFKSSEFSPVGCFRLSESGAQLADFIIRGEFISQSIHDL